MSGATATRRPPFHGVTPIGKRNPSAKVWAFSNVPSPSVSVRQRIRPRSSGPVPTPAFGYPRISQTYIRPCSSKHMATGSMMSGSDATRVARKPGASRNVANSSRGDSGPRAFPRLGVTGSAALTVSADQPTTQSATMCWGYIIEISSSDCSWPRGGPAGEIVVGYLSRMFHDWQRSRVFTSAVHVAWMGCIARSARP